MRLLWIGGDEIRHFYYFREISHHFEVVGAIVQRWDKDGKSLMPECAEDAKNLARFARERAQKERELLGNPTGPSCETLEVDSRGLSGRASAEFVRSKRPDVVLLFGCGMVRAPLLDVLPSTAINLHLGLTPRYRGAGTLFWPFYFLEPNHAGGTFHHLSEAPDAGDVIHQCTPSLHPADGFHHVATSTVVSCTEEMLHLLALRSQGREWTRHPQARGGRTFRTGDLRPHHLRMIYEVYSDDMVKHFLEGQLEVRPTRLTRQF
jgi:methionyl-tRNA formyltransferase